MVGKAGKGQSGMVLILLILTCSIIGSFLGDILKPYLPKLFMQSFAIGVGPLPVNLKVINMTFGFNINMNLMSIIGLVAAVIIYKKF